MTELFRKLNFKGQSPILVLDAPSSFDSELSAMKKETRVVKEARQGEAYSFAIAFARKKPDFEREASLLSASTLPDAVLWIAFPLKNPSGCEGDLSRDLCFETGFTFGLKANRQVAIDEDWTAMRYERL